MPEPIGPYVSKAALLTARLEAEPWIHDISPFAAPIGDYRDIPFTAGVYLLLTRDRRLVRLGQARRMSDVRGRVSEHLRVPARAALIDSIHVIGLQDHVDPAIVNYLEGVVADLVGCRGRMGSQRWPAARRAA